MNGADAALIITSLVGPAGIGGAFTVIRQWRKGKADPVSTQQVRASEAARLAVSAGLEEAYSGVLQRFAIQIADLEKGRDENRERIMSLERRDSVHLFYAFQLRAHIEQQLPPPPPPWPMEIDPNHSS